MRTLLAINLLMAAVLHGAAAAAVRAADGGGGRANVVVAADGGGDFSTVQAAVDSVPRDARERVTLEIRPGTYREVVTVPGDAPPMTFRGTDAETTVLTFSNFAKTLGPDGKELGTFRSASVFVVGSDFVAENLTFENAAGAVGQALALNVEGDRATFRKCRFLGWQDTLLTNRNRQYFEDCYIAGHVDFIFGSSTAWFERCEVRALGKGYLTAASTQKDAAFGYVFSHCRVTAAAGVPAASTYLGRPWRPYASVTFLDAELGDVVRPAGWENWRNPENEKTARYAEHRGTGPGARPGERAAWSRQLSDAEAAAVTLAAVLGGADHWDPTAPPAAATTRPEKRP